LAAHRNHDRAKYQAAAATSAFSAGISAYGTVAAAAADRTVATTAALVTFAKPVDRQSTVLKCDSDIHLLSP
jgi:hypothetical protein